MAIVELSNVSKKYGTVQAMDGISFSIPSGVVFALLGENGAGKTTTIKTMLGLEHPDSGSIKILDLEPLDSLEAKSVSVGPPSTITP